jgi:hypothetical protein
MDSIPFGKATVGIVVTVGMAIMTSRIERGSALRMRTILGCRTMVTEDGKRGQMDSATDSPSLWQRIDGYQSAKWGRRDGLLRATMWGNRVGWDTTEALIEKIRELESRIELLETGRVSK